MFKKLTAFSLLFLANIILVAYAVIPHHHHQKLVCIEKVHCADDDTCHKNVLPTHSHEHNGNCNSASCILKVDIVLPSDQEYRDSSLQQTDSDNLNDLQFVLFSTDFETLAHYISNKTSFPDFIPYYSSFITSSLGLRAPPVV